MGNSSQLIRPQRFLYQPHQLCFAPAHRGKKPHKLNPTQAWRFVLKCMLSWTKSRHTYVQTGTNGSVMHPFRISIFPLHREAVWHQYSHVFMRSWMLMHVCMCAHMCRHLSDLPPLPPQTHTQGPFWEDRTPLPSVEHEYLPRCGSSFMPTDNQSPYLPVE